MLAARDQENLVHAQQTAGAAKPLNQGVRQLPPKTPSAKAPKTPFKVPLNDENAIRAFKGVGKGNDIQTAGRKFGLVNSNAFITPIGPRARAPLGAKTTNAKARTFQVPSDTVSRQPEANTVSARKPKPKPSKVEIASIEDILSITNDENYPEPEYMPPRGIPFEDRPDDAHLLDFTPISDAQMRIDIAQSVTEERGDDGLTRAEREEVELKREVKYEIQMTDLEAEHRRKGLEIPCIHIEDCDGICSINGDKQDKADEWFREEKEKLDEKYKDVRDRQKNLQQEREEREGAQKGGNKRSDSGPNSLTSQTAASALAQKSSSMAFTAKPNTGATISKPSLPSYMLPTRAKQHPMAAPDSSLTANKARHNTAVAASRTTMGYSKGRSTSAALRGITIPPPPTSTLSNKKMPLSNKTNTTRGPTKYSSTASSVYKKSTVATDAPSRKSIWPAQNPVILPNGEKADQSLPPSLYLQRYGKPPVGSKMWMQCMTTGAFDEEPDLGEGGYVFGEGGGELEPWEVEGALDDFQLEVPGI